MTTPGHVLTALDAQGRVGWQPGGGGSGPWSQTGNDIINTNSGTVDITSTNGNINLETGLTPGQSINLTTNAGDINLSTTGGNVVVGSGSKIVLEPVSESQIYYAGNVLSVVAGTGNAADINAELNVNISSDQAIGLNAAIDVNVDAQNNINLTSALANINLVCSGVAGNISLTPGLPQGLVTISGKLRIPNTVDYALIPSPANGFIAYDTTLGKFVGYENGAWVQFTTSLLP